MFTFYSVHILLVYSILTFPAILIPEIMTTIVNYSLLILTNFNMRPFMTFPCHSENPRRQRHLVSMSICKMDTQNILMGSI